MAAKNLSSRSLRRITDTLRRDEMGSRNDPPEFDLPEDDSIWEPYKNVGDAIKGEIPPYGIIYATGYLQVSNEAQKILQCQRVSTVFERLWFVNGSEAVPRAEFGVCQRLSDIGLVKYNTSGVTPAFGQHWGPKKDSYELWPNRPGFVIAGLDETLPEGVVRARQYEVNDLWGKMPGGMSGRVSANEARTQLMDIWFPDANAAGTQWADSTWDITVDNMSAFSVTLAKFVRAFHHAGRWGLVFEDCG